MIKQTVGAKPPTGWRKVLFRLPIWFYRCGMGWLFGRRLLLLVHQGRKSGIRRQVVLEVAEYDPVQNSYLVASGFGKQSQWYQNLLVHPTTTIQVGRERIAVRAHFLSREESGRAMVRYSQRQPGTARMICGYLGIELDGSDEAYYQVGERFVPFVALTPVTPESP